ncbi:BglII/BstYI family type II restriction endonuclease [Bacteroides sp.]|uniref:BglII/BstYI family type II restriction endonuclease n=1 Tax=Bacteroides sp. TaxID=29523 RepID=UPI002A81831D|nr:BglII/BstYI family type II restriction endonuclease [Bacteroides sp.]
MIEKLPQEIQDLYEIHEYRHAIAILQVDFPSEYQNIIDMLLAFRLKKSDILLAGGRKSTISDFLDSFLYERKWVEKMFTTKLIIDGHEYDTPTHKIDCYKNRIALDIEWNNKDPFYDRDLNNYRLLHDRNAISVAVIVTRCTNLQDIFNKLGKGGSYGASTTHMDKLIPRIEGGSGGGCPILVFGITKELYIDQ